jgi:hydroxypyruvate isomerase
MDRREALRNIGATAVAPAFFPSMTVERAPTSAGRLKQSVSYWPYNRIPLAQFAVQAKQAGVVAIDLLQPEEWPVVQNAGLVSSMGYPSRRRDFLTRGFNNPANHDLLVDEIEKTLPLAAAAKVPNVIAMFGNRNGIADDRGADACIAGLSRVKASAEKHGVTVCVELLNSKIDHKDYMGDSTPWAVKVMQGVNSPRVKLLYDIYHMQIMEGDVVRTIRDHIAHIGHFHTGGVPGRNEIDDGQELNYRRVCTAIADAGFTGYVAHEFIPKRDPLTSLAEAVKICDV